MPNPRNSLSANDTSTGGGTAPPVRPHRHVASDNTNSTSAQNAITERQHQQQQQQQQQHTSSPPLRPTRSLRKSVFIQPPANSHVTSTTGMNEQQQNVEQSRSMNRDSNTSDSSNKSNSYYDGHGFETIDGFLFCTTLPPVNSFSVAEKHFPSQKQSEVQVTRFFIDT